MENSIHELKRPAQWCYHTLVALSKKDYLEALKTRAKQSKVYRPYQLHGLEIAEILGDEKHTSLYIKLAKEYDAQTLRALARSVAEKRDVKNKGAYFMAVWAAEHPRPAATPLKPRKTGRAKRAPKRTINNGQKNIPAR